MSRRKWVGALGGLVLLTLGAEKLCAQQDIPETCTFAATFIIQNTNSTYNTNTTAFTTPPPTMLKVATKDILNLIARAEFNRGNYGATNFPSGAKLVKSYTVYPSFSVWGQTNNVLLDSADDEITLSYGQFNGFCAYTDSGTGNQSTAGSETDYGFVELDIYDLDAGGVIDLQLFGNVVNTIKTSAASKTTGMINNTQSFSVKALGGGGDVGYGYTNEVVNCAVSGSFSAKGTAQTF